MACEGLLTIGDFAFPGIFGGDPPQNDSPTAAPKSTADENLQFVADNLGCATALTVVPVYYEPNGLLYSAITTGTLSLTNYTANLVVDTPPGFSEDINLEFVVTPLVGPAVNYGGVRFDVNPDGTYSTTVTLTQPTVDLTPGDFIRFFVTEGHFTYFTLTSTWTPGNTILAVPDPALFLACVIPACGVAPVNPFPPNLPYMPPFPTITPGPPGSQLRINWQPTHMSSGFLAPLANYSVFSDFGQNYGYKPTR